MFIFLTRTAQKDSLLKHLKVSGYIEMSKELNPRWMLWLIKKGTAVQ